MKPTWEGWPEVYAAQQADIYPPRTCTYNGRWTEHDDVNWSEWQITIDMPGQTMYPISWDHCVDSYENLVEMISKLSMLIESSGLWNPVHDNTATLWQPVEYPK